MDCINRLTVRMIIGLVLSLFLHLSVRAEVVSNCFEILPGYLPHIRWVDNIAVDFAIDKYGARGWVVPVHHTRGLGYVENAKLSQTVNNETFNRDLNTVEGEGEEFSFVFRWWHTFSTINSEAVTLKLYGWITLGTENGELVIKRCECSEVENEVVVSQDDNIGLMTRRRMRSAAFASARSCHYWTAECYTGKNENHKLFERLVHITPSLSSSVLMRTILAAYNRIGGFQFLF